MSTQPPISPDEIVTISQVRPKPGQLESFVEIQTAFQQNVASEIDGLIGGRLLIAEDRQSLVIMARFRSNADLEKWTHSARFGQHMARVRPMLEPPSPGRFHVLYQSGTV
ncbi:antibiotic biosynthesis monooxygenase [Thalassospira sp.]|uniref:antibiotic biosynthesis monooxygenase family protein n=1 Tax=Thalassospira sp. TaxID=1912094 RepID=UPI0032EF06F1